MKIRRDSVFISSVLFTIAFLSCIPPISEDALTGRHPNPALDSCCAEVARLFGDLGVASLAILFIGLTVTWTGYVKRVRWTWFVMFIIVWVWAFPLMILPLFKGRIVLTFSEWLYSAIYQPGSPRIWAESVLIFLLMAIALLLPIKSFFFIKEIEEPSHRLSTRLIGFSVMGVLVIMIALFAWIRLGILYDIPLTELNSAQQLPAPPPPPIPCKAQ